MSALANDIVALKLGLYTSKWSLSNWNTLPKYSKIAPPKSIKLVSWNVDFMAPRAEDRLRCAMDHIRSHLEEPTEDGSVSHRIFPSCVLLQEIHGDAMSIILRNKWIREHFIVVPTSTRYWPSSRYGNVTLISSTVPAVRAQSLVFGNSRMGRNAVVVDVHLAAPGSDTPALLRIANVHLESLPEGTSKRPEQLLSTAELLRADGVQAGVVAGDMNPIDSRDASLPAEASLTDAYQGAEDDESAFTWGYQPRNRFPACRMDKILYTGSAVLEVDAPCRIGVGLKMATGQWVSDHYGLITTVRFGEDQTVENGHSSIGHQSDSACVAVTGRSVS